MAAGAHLVTNRISSDCTITPSSEDSSYPKTNLYDKQASKLFKSESLTTLTMLIDFGAAIAADTIALINHNLTSGATLSLKADGSNPPTTEIATPTYRQYNMWKTFTDPSARYYQLEITDSNTAYLYIGQLIIGTRTAFPRNRKIGSGYSPARNRSNISEQTYAGVFWNYHLFERNIFNPSFRTFTAAQEDIFRALDAAVYGSLYPFLWIPNTDEAACYYVRKEAEYRPQEFNQTSEGSSVHDYMLTLIEESRGLDIQA